MATKSFLKDIKITDKQLAHTFVEALDKTEHSKYKQVQLSRNSVEITGDKIKDFFGKI